MFFNLFTPPEPEPIAVAHLRGYKLETVQCTAKGCAAPYHSRLTYLDPWSGNEVGRCQHIWDHSTFLVAVSGHHRIAMAITDQAGPDWVLATKRTLAGGGGLRRQSLRREAQAVGAGTWSARPAVPTSLDDRGSLSQTLRRWTQRKGRAVA